MKKGIILFGIIIIIFFASITYADTYSELIARINIITKQRQQREPIELELKGRGYGGRELIYITTVIKVKEKKPKE